MPDQKLCRSFGVRDQMAHQCPWTLGGALCWFGNPDRNSDPDGRKKTYQGSNPDYLHDSEEAHDHAGQYWSDHSYEGDRLGH